MTMLRGSVSVADDESVTGNGCALVLYEADIGTIVLPVLPALGSTAAPYRVERPVMASDVAQTQAARLALLREAARRANAYSIMVTYLKDLAECDVVVSAGGLQRLPSSLVAGAPTDAPSAPVTLTGVLT